MFLGAVGEPLGRETSKKGRVEGPTTSGRRLGDATHWEGGRREGEPITRMSVAAHLAAVEAGEAVRGLARRGARALSGTRLPRPERRAFPTEHTASGRDAGRAAGGTEGAGERRGAAA